MFKIKSNIDKVKQRILVKLENIPLAINDESEKVMKDVLTSMKKRTSHFWQAHDPESVYSNLSNVEKITSGNKTTYRIKNFAKHNIFLIEGVKPHKVWNPDYEYKFANKDGRYSKTLLNRYTTPGSARLSDWFKTHKAVKDKKWIWVGGPNSRIKKGNSDRDYVTPSIEKVFGNKQDKVLQRIKKRINQEINK